MAIQEENTNTTTGPVPAPLTGPLPLYPEMIITAIDSLNEVNGASKVAISKQIESTYGTLPPAHATLLTHHLNKMKQMGQLLMVKNNYMKPDPNSPVRRGRGRPPKPKPELPADYVPPPPRPRGRPPNPLSSPPKIVSPNTSGRKRGRPPKAGKTIASPPPPPPIAVAEASPSARRGRGRPPKVNPAVASPVGA